MIIRARIVVTMNGPPLENGAVAIKGNKIVDLGSFDEVAARHAGQKIVDLGEQALLPGLINSHCHLDYTCLRGKIAPQKSFTDWIRAINAAKEKLSEQDYIASINNGFAEAKKFGTTTIANLTAFPELAAKIDEPVRTVWFAELIDIRNPNEAKQLVDLAVEALKSKRHWGLAPHAPFTASAELYRRCGEVARRENILLTTHLAESREEMSMFRDASGPLYEFLSEIGRDMDDCGRETPLGYFSKISGDPSTSLGMTKRAIEVNRPYPNWIVAHLNEIDENDFDLLVRAASANSTTAAGSRENISVVHCPRSHKYFGHSPFQFKKLRALGMNVCLGTDSLASNEDLNLFSEMREFQKRFSTISPEEILSMVTVKAARALDRDNELGRIRPGFAADLIAIPFGGAAGEVFEAILNHEKAIAWEMEK